LKAWGKGGVGREESEEKRKHTEKENEREPTKVDNGMLSEEEDDGLAIFLGFETDLIRESNEAG